MAAPIVTHAGWPKKKTLREPLQLIIIRENDLVFAPASS